jgi:hypothetical protein
MMPLLLEKDRIKGEISERNGRKTIVSCHACPKDSPGCLLEGQIRSTLLLHKAKP